MNELAGRHLLVGIPASRTLDALVFPSPSAPWRDVAEMWEGLK